MKSWVPMSLLLGVVISLSGCLHKTPQVWEHPIPPPPPPQEQDWEFDLVGGTDANYPSLNGFMMNPDWLYHKTAQDCSTAADPLECFPPKNKKDHCSTRPDDSAREQKCTHQEPYVDKPPFPNSAICFLENSKIHGHVDWALSELYGRAAWLNYADDFDYNLLFVPDSPVMFTKNNNSATVEGKSQPYIEAEFNDDETVNNFTTDWWQKFRDKVREEGSSDDHSDIDEMLGSRCNGALPPRAVLLGVGGLDCEHACRSEVHPVYALGIETDESGAKNTWAIFVRNSGDGGFCSRANNLYDPPDHKLRLFLPRATVGRPHLLDSDFASTPDQSGHASIAPPQVNWIPNLGVVLTFDVPAAIDRDIAELFLNLKWDDDTFTPASCPIAQPAGLRQLWSERLRRSQNPQEAESAEEYLGALHRQKTRERLALSPQLNVLRLHRTVKVAMPAAEIAPYSRPTGTPSMPSLVQETQNITKQQRDTALVKTVCAEYDNNPPTDRVKDFPKVCRKLNK